MSRKLTKNCCTVPVTNMEGKEGVFIFCIGQWLMENPMYDIDPKWADLVKERGNLSHDLQKRLPGPMKKGNPGRPPLLSSPTGSTSSVSSANLNNLQFSSLASAGLAGLNPNLLSGLSGLGQFDPKNPLFDPKNPIFDPKNNPLFDPKNNPLFDPKNNPLFDPKNNPLFDPKNPLLMPFASAGIPNMSALNSMAGLGNLGNMNLFANLAGLGLPGLGMDPSALAGDKSKVSGSGSSSSEKVKQQKPTEAHSSSKPGTSSAASSMQNSPFPYFFPNPSLLYTPLGLGGLNPFALQPGMSAAYESLAQQCNLLNGGGLNPAASPGSKSNKSSGGRPSTSGTSASTSSKVTKQCFLNFINKG